MSLRAPVASSTRYSVIVFAIVLAVIQYIDRGAISQAKGDISKDLGSSDLQMGAIFGAFGLAYSLFEIPTGWLGDKIGARKVLMRVVPLVVLFHRRHSGAWTYVSMPVHGPSHAVGEGARLANPRLLAVSSVDQAASVSRQRRVFPPPAPPSIVALASSLAISIIRRSTLTLGSTI